MADKTPYVPQTWTDGSSSASAARLNYIEDGILELSYAPAVRVFHNAAQSIASATETALQFNSERFDQAANAADTMHDTITNNSRLTCRYAGIYLIGGHAQWAASPAGAQMYIRLGGATIIGRTLINAADYQVMSLTTAYQLAVNEYVELVVRQSTGGALSILSGSGSPEFWMVRVA